MTYSDEFAKAVAAVMADNQWSQVRAERLTGVDRTTVGNMRQGKVPTRETIERWADGIAALNEADDDGRLRERLKWLQLAGYDTALLTYRAQGGETAQGDVPVVRERPASYAADDASEPNGLQLAAEAGLRVAELPEPTPDDVWLFCQRLPRQGRMEVARRIIEDLAQQDAGD